MVHRILEASSRGWVAQWVHGRTGQAEARTGTLLLAGTRPGWPWMAQPQSGIWSVGLHLWKTDGFRKEGRNEKAHLCTVLPLS